MEELTGYCSAQFWRVLRETEGARLRNITLWDDAYNRQTIVRLSLHGHPDFNFVLPEHILHNLSVTGMALPHALSGLERLYWLNFEDYQVDRELEVYRAEFRRFMRSTEDVERVRQARYELAMREEHVRENHRLARTRTYSFPALRFTDDLMPMLPEPSLRQSATEARIREEAARHFNLQWDNFARDLLVYGQAAWLTGFGDDEAEKRALELLKERLTPAQRKQYDKHQWFEVRGSDTGKRYRINHGRQMNIDELDARGRKNVGWCFLPQGGLAAGDCMLAQKIALETQETKALAVANRIWSRPDCDGQGLISYSTVTVRQENPNLVFDSRMWTGDPRPP